MQFSTEVQSVGAEANVGTVWVSTCTGGATASSIFMHDRDAVHHHITSNRITTEVTEKCSKIGGSTGRCIRKEARGRQGRTI